MTRVERRRLVVASLAVLGAGAGVSGAKIMAVGGALGPSRRLRGLRRGRVEPGPERSGPIRRVEPDGATVLEAVWLGGRDPSAGGARLEWREPFMFHTGTELGSQPGMSPAPRPAATPRARRLRRIPEPDTVSLIRGDGTRVPCLEGTAFLLRR